jgi:pyruvate formate-lyase/glycerol dehydratase family glycyl radical enzyme
VTLQLSDRTKTIHREIMAAKPALCAERAVLVTRYCRRRASGRKPAIQRRAEALATVLRDKVVRIHDSELLVGCFTSHRVGGGLYPELHGVPMLEDLLEFERREVNPLTVSAIERNQLLAEVVPYWLPRFLAMQIRPRYRALPFIASQLAPTFYLINETGGISHIVPDYQGLIERGTAGFRREARDRLADLPSGSEEARFCEAIQIVCDGLDDFAAGYRREATRLAGCETDPQRRAELEHIAEVCRQVPRNPARSLHEALQSILFAQIALNLESLDNAVSPGRLDQILFPTYRADIEAGISDQAGAFELLGCFALKLCEIIPAFSRRVTRFHGGLFNGQAVVVGGTDEEGRDASNELSALWLTVMDQLRTRQPNYHARIHRDSPPAYRRQVASILADKAASPALYNDEVIVPMLQSRGVSEADARNYATVGCVEPVAAGKSFFSTDAALFNLPLCLELALNRGRRFGARRRSGAATEGAEDCRSIDDVIDLFRVQLDHGVRKLLSDLALIEGANAEVHPTPLTSMLLHGCLARGRDASRGGAEYNGSGIQGVGIVEVGDSLAAIEAVVFRDRKTTMTELVAACRDNFDGCESLLARLRGAPAYGNDEPFADRFTAQVMELFASSLTGRLSRRGGDYVAGFYSVTAHQAFGEIVGALPSGRLAGAPFSSGISPRSGASMRGPTAALMSQAALPLHLAKNGINFNLELAPWTVGDGQGSDLLEGLIAGGFDAGCMQMQVNVVDPKMLLEARDNPGRYPGLLVRVSGYSAYFDDLSPEMKEEIINRNLHDVGRGG